MLSRQYHAAPDNERLGVHGAVEGQVPGADEPCGVWGVGDEASAGAVAILSQTAVWYSTGFPPVPIRWVLIRDPRGAFATQALLCTDLDADSQQVLTWFVLRWQVEVTFHEVRAHLGVETQRQWSERAILRTTPALMGLFSLVTLLAHPPLSRCPSCLHQDAWYAKALPTFGDALAWVRRRRWTQTIFQTSPCAGEGENVLRALLDHLAALLCSAA